jgi:hypothetical protein
MPSPEGRGGQPGNPHQPEQPPGQGEPHNEREPTPYYQAAKFGNEQLAGVVYFQAQEAIYEDEQCDLSAYRLQIRHIWHVAVIGEQPAIETEQRIGAVLSFGELVTLPPEVLKFLNARRAQTIKEGSWVERHHRPGKQFDL